MLSTRGGETDFSTASRRRGRRGRHGRTAADHQTPPASMTKPVDTGKRTCIVRKLKLEAGPNLSRSRSASSPRARGKRRWAAPHSASVYRRLIHKPHAGAATNVLPLTGRTITLRIQSISKKNDASETIIGRSYNDGHREDVMKRISAVAAVLSSLLMATALTPAGAADMTFERALNVA